MAFKCIDFSEVINSVSVNEENLGYSQETV